MVSKTLWINGRQLQTVKKLERPLNDPKSTQSAGVAQVTQFSGEHEQVTFLVKIHL